MKNKYRLMYNGHLYKIQYRFLYFFWLSKRAAIGYKKIKDVMYYTSREVAEIEMEKLENAYVEKHSKFKQITSKRTTKLWKGLRGKL